VHAKFVKYSRGVFDGPSITIKKTGNNLKVNGSYEYADTIAGVILKAGTGKIKASGNIFSRTEIKNSLATKTKKKPGLYNTEIKGEADAKSLLDLYNAAKDATFYVELQSDKAHLKTKKKPPKPGSDRDEEFFTASLDAGMADILIKDVCFDCAKKDFTEIKISHTFRIDAFVVPEQYRSDAAKARIHAKERGR